MDFDNMVAIYKDFKWLGFWISDPFQNLDHLQTNLFLTIPNSEDYWLQIHTVLGYQTGFLLLNAELVRLKKIESAIICVTSFNKWL